MDVIASNLRLHFLYVDKYTFSEKWLYPENPVPYCMFRYILSGSAVFAINGENYRVQAGDVFYIPNGCMLSCHAEESIAFISVRFVNSLEPQGGNLLGERYRIPMLNPMLGEQIGPYFEQLYQCAIGQSLTKMLRINACLSWIAAILSERATATLLPGEDSALPDDAFELPALKRRADHSAVKQDPRITAVVDYMLTHPQENLSIQSMSMMAGISESGFRRLFKHQTGKSPVDFMKEFRMMNAARRLLKSDDSIAQVAYSVGYETPNYFSRCFRQTFGLSPQDYRKRSQQL